MDLKQFIEITLTQIVDGVIEANKNLSEKGAVVNPKNVRATERGQFYDHIEGILINNIEFDVALTTINTEKGSAGGGIKIAGFSVGTELGNQTSNHTVSRIKFNIPLQLPNK